MTAQQIARTSAVPQVKPSAWLLISIAYVVTGKLGLLLAQPPGYASAIFPPAGIAVAAALVGGRASLPWIFLSSLLLNLWVGYNADTPINVLAPAFLIAIASTLQALAGGTLLRNRLGYPTRLDNSRDISLFVLSAPLICLVSASLSVGGLLVLGIMPFANGGANWLSWWMGDTMGILVMLPITLVTFGEPRQLWRHRATTVALPIILAFLLAVSGFIVISRWEYHDSLAEFRSLVRQSSEELRLRFEQQESLLEQVEAFLSHGVDRPVTRTEFAHIVRPSLIRFPMVQAVEWAPRVTRQERTGFEVKQRMDSPGFEIRERDANERLQRAMPRDFYNPVTYIEPILRNETAIGFDLASNPERRTALLQSASTAEPVATAPLKLVQGAQSQTGILLIKTVREGDRKGDAVLTVLRMDDFMTRLLEFANTQVQARLIDVAAGKPLFDSFNAVSDRDLTAETLVLGTRQYRLEMAPTPAYLAAHRGWQSWGVLTASLLGTGLLGMLLLLGSGQKAHAETLVEERTRELHASEARHRALFNHCKSPMLLIDPEDGAIVNANAAAETFYGYSSEQLLAMHMADINQLSPDEINAEMALAVSEKRECFYFPHRLASGAIRQVEVHSGPLEIDDRKLLYSIITDITDRRVSEMALAKETARLNALLEAASDGIHILDQNGNLGQFSQSFASMLGYTDEEISGFNVVDWDAQIPKEKIPEVIQDLIKTPATFETQHRRKDGTLIDVEIHAKAIEIAGENFLYASSRDIAERKHNEAIAEELGRDVAQLNQRLSIATDSAHIGVWDYSIPENRLVWDNWMYALYGIREEDFSGAYEAWQNGLHPDDKARGDEEIRQALRDEKKFDTEFRVKWPSGEVRHLKAAAVVLRDAEGKPLRMIGVNYDITERKRHEEEAANQRRRLNDIIEGTNVGTGEWNIQTGETVFNDRWVQMLGYTREELASTTIDTWSRLVQPDDLNRSRELILRHFAGELAYHQSEVRMRHKDGHWVWVLLRGKVSSWTADGKPLLMSGTQQDISASKKAEEEIRQAELLLRSAIETIGEAFVVYDAEDRLAFCNEKYRELYALSAPVIEPGRSFEEIIRYGVERRQYKNAIGREEAWIAERLATHRQGHQDLVQQLDDGRWLRIMERRTASGQIVGFRVDVTEYYRAKEAAEAASVAKSRFLATMSHEIRTPMNGILGMAQLLLTPTIKDDERLDYARIILDSGQTLLALLNDILDISKVEAGKLELESIPFEPARIIHEIRVLFAEAARQKGLRIESVWVDATGQSSQPGQRYLGDPHRLRQMLSNLVGNALKFTAKGHIRIEAREVERDGTHTLLEFKVTDTGIGIPEEKQTLLFKAFSQADSSTTRQFGGTGLGLSLVRNLAKLMGGNVGIKSEPGQGSCFSFRIRVELLAVGEDSRDEVRRLIVDADATAPGIRSGTFAGHILVVEATRPTDWCSRQCSKNPESNVTSSRMVSRPWH